MLKGMFLVPCCLFLLPNLLLVSRHQNLAQRRKFRCAEADHQKTDSHRGQKKWQGCSCNHRQKSRASCAWDATSQRLGSRYPRGEYSTVGVRSKQNARKEDRTCMRCVTRSLTSRTYFCRSAEQGCLSVKPRRKSKHTQMRVCAPRPSCAVPHLVPTKQTSARMAP